MTVSRPSEPKTVSDLARAEDFLSVAAIILIRLLSVKGYGVDAYPRCLFAFL